MLVITDYQGTGQTPVGGNALAVVYKINLEIVVQLDNFVPIIKSHIFGRTIFARHFCIQKLFLGLL
jgi:hypothetical protein